MTSQKSRSISAQRCPTQNGTQYGCGTIRGSNPTSAAIGTMGVGGRLVEDQPSYPRAAHSKGPIAAVVLAAGRSSRTSPEHKLLATDSAGGTLISHTVKQALASSAEPVCVVLGHQADAIELSLSALPGNIGGKLNFVRAADYATGLSASLHAGLASLPDGTAGVLICLGDMPFVTTATIDRLIGAFVPGHIIVPVHAGQRGNPVLWDRRFVPEMMNVTGDRGARDMLVQHSEFVIEIAVGDGSILRDCDTAESLLAWAKSECAQAETRNSRAKRRD